MTLTVSGAETQTRLLSLYYSILLVIGNVRLPTKLAWIAFFTLRNPQCNKSIMIYIMLAFHILIHMSGPDSST